MILWKPADNPRPDLCAELGGGGEKEDGVDHELAASKYFHEEEKNIMRRERIFVQGGDKYLMNRIEEFYKEEQNLLTGRTQIFYYTNL